MSEYVATVTWQGHDARFVDNRYSRAHTWHFDGGAVVPASSSPHVVPVPLSDASAVDPEEAFVASLSSCHMLMFLSIAAKRGLRALSYHDRATGVLAQDASGKLAMTQVTLHPHVIFARGQGVVTAEVVSALHHEAHEKCFIASSVKTNLTTNPTFEVSGEAS